MTLQRAWRQGIKILRRAGTETPVLDAEVLLRHVTGFSREAFYRELMTPWTGKFQPEWMEILHRRAQGTPVAYLVGRKEFFGLELRVTEAVLVPRPETEILVERALQLVHAGLVKPKAKVLDIGTGSGAIAVALAVNLPQIHVTATDLSAAALELAQYNADRHRVGSRLRFCQGDLWPPAGSFQMVVSNPPYIPSLKLKGLRPEVRTEPIQALDGGRDGLTYYRRIAVGLHQYLSPPGWVLLEVGARQAEEVGGLMAAVGLTVLPPVCDLAGTPRLVQGYFK